MSSKRSASSAMGQKSSSRAPVSKRKEKEPEDEAITNDEESIVLNLGSKKRTHAKSEEDAAPPPPADAGLAASEEDEDEKPAEPVAKKPRAEPSKQAVAVVNIPAGMTEPVKKLTMDLLKFTSTKILSFTQKYANQDGMVFFPFWSAAGQKITDEIRESLNLHLININAKKWITTKTAWTNKQTPNGFFINIGTEAKKAGNVNPATYMTPPLMLTFSGASLEPKKPTAADTAAGAPQTFEGPPNFYVSLHNTFPKDIVDAKPYIQAQANLYQIILHIFSTNLLLWTLEEKNKANCWGDECFEALWSGFTKQNPKLAEDYEMLDGEDDEEPEETQKREAENERREIARQVKIREIFINNAQKGFERKQHEKTWFNNFKVKRGLLRNMSAAEAEQWAKDKPVVEAQYKAEQQSGKKNPNLKEKDRALLTKGKVWTAPHVCVGRKRIPATLQGIEQMAPAIAQAHNIHFKIVCSDKNAMTNFGVSGGWNSFFADSKPELTISKRFPRGDSASDPVYCVFDDEYDTESSKKTEEEEEGESENPGVGGEE